MLHTEGGVGDSKNYIYFNFGQTAEAIWKSRSQRLYETSVTIASVILMRDNSFLVYTMTYNLIIIIEVI